MKNKKEGNGHWLKRLFGRLALVLLLLVLFVFISSAVISYFFEDEVADAALRQVYKTVDTEVSHKQVSLSLWRKFPKVSLKVDGFAVKAKKSDEDLLEVETLYLQFNLVQLLKNTFELQRVSVSHATLYLERYSKNRCNWDIFRTSDDTSENSLSLALAALSLSDVTVCYVDDEQRLYGRGVLEHLTAKGHFKQEHCDLKCALSFSIDTLQSDTQLLWTNRQFRMKGMTVMDLEQQAYRLHDLYIGISKINAVADAALKKADVGWDFSVRLNGKRQSLSDLLAELPADLRQPLDSCRLQGLLSWEMTAQGNSMSQTQVILDGLLEKALFQPAGSDAALKSVMAELHYETYFPDWEEHSQLQVKTFSAALATGRIMGSATASNFVHPHLQVQLQAALQLADLKELLPQIALYQIGGKADVQLKMDHVFEDWAHCSLQNLGDADLSGSMTLKKGLLRVDSSSFLWDDFSASLLFSGQTLEVVRFNGKVQGNKCGMTAKVSPIYDFMFVEGSKLHVTGQLNSPMLNVDAFFPPVSVETESVSSSDAAKAVCLPDFLEAELQIKADKLKYDRFEAQNVMGKLIYRDAAVEVKDFTLQALAGKVQLQARLQALLSGNFMLNADASANQVDIQRLFYVLHDFGVNGENGLTHRNIRGKASAEMFFSAKMDSCLVMDPESVDCEADLTVANGQLLNYKALESLSTFVKLEDLKEVKFETLKNRILIHRKVVQIPEMEVKNNLLNLVLSGSQTFDGDLNYNVSLYLNELLSKKRKERVPSDEFGEVVENGKYGVRLHLLVAGNLDQPQFKWNHKKANEGLRQSFKQQGEELKGLFRSDKQTEGKDSLSGSDNSSVNSSKRKKDKLLNDSRQKQEELDIEDW
ncbi:MAG: hypothetical protein J5792_00080 [Bacteroidales bacterium]|nr:hypothetical protein [Bacteroidales bacterium]